MGNFEQRLELTGKIEKSLPKLFYGDEVSIQTFGCDAIVQGNTDLEEYIKEPEVNQQASGMIVKFAPDFILLKKDRPKQLYFLDVKHSISPVWQDKRLDMLRQKNNDKTLTRSRIGVVAREAMLSYRRYYPNTIILMASPYSPKLLMAQFADKVKCLYCYRKTENGEYDCNNCPAKNGGFFDIERATKSVGSQTPITNVDLDSFEPVDEFFEKIGIKVNNQELKLLKKLVQNEEIKFGNQKDVKLCNRIKRELNRSGCAWMEYQVYSNEDNDFIHHEIECFCLKDKKHLQIYGSEREAHDAGKKKRCKFCCEN